MADDGVGWPVHQKRHDIHHKEESQQNDDTRLNRNLTPTNKILPSSSSFLPKKITMPYFFTLFSGKGWPFNREVAKKDQQITCTSKQKQFIDNGNILQEAVFEQYGEFKMSLDHVDDQLKERNKTYKDLVDKKHRHDKLLREEEQLEEKLRLNKEKQKEARNAVVTHLENCESKSKFFLNSALKFLDMKKTFFYERAKFVLYAQHDGKKFKCNLETFADEEHPENNFWNYHGSQLKKCKQIKEAVEAASQVQQDLEDLRSSTFAESVFQHQVEHQQVESVADASNTHAPTAGVVEEHHGRQNSRRRQPPFQEADAEAVDAAPQVQEELEVLRSTFAEASQHQVEHQQVESVVDASSTHAPTAGIVEERGRQNSRRGQPPLQADAADSPRRLWVGGYPNTPFAAIREGTGMELDYTPSEEGDTPLLGMNILEHESRSGSYLSPDSTEPSIAHDDHEANDAVADGFLVDNAAANDNLAAENANVTNVEAENAVLLWKKEEEIQPGKCRIQGCTKPEQNDVAKVCARHWKAEPAKDSKYRLLCRIPGCEKQTIGGDCRCVKHGGQIRKCVVNGCKKWGDNRYVGDENVGKFCEDHWNEKLSSIILSAGDDATGNSGVSRSVDENSDPQQSNANIAARHL